LCKGEMNEELHRGNGTHHDGVVDGAC
jgi:hypothetical protein